MDWLVLWMALALPRVSLVVSPRIVMGGHSTRLECRVARHPENRQLRYGLAEWSESERQLDGERAQVVWTTTLQVPCGEWVAYCLVVDATGKHWQARQSVTAICGEA